MLSAHDWYVRAGSYNIRTLRDNSLGNIACQFQQHALCLHRQLLYSNLKYSYFTFLDMDALDGDSSKLKHRGVPVDRDIVQASHILGLYKSRKMAVLHLFNKLDSFGQS